MNQNTVFNLLSTEEEELIKEYYIRNTRKKEDESWLKKHKDTIVNILNRIGKDKVNVGDIRVSVVTPDYSRFDEDKVLEFLKSKGEDIFNKCTKVVVDEEALTKAIEEGDIDINELKAYAWVSIQGTPRLTVSKVR